KIWSVATRDKKEIDSLNRGVCVYRQNEGGTISHGLATALINRNGMIEKIWRGNAWTPAEVVEEIKRNEQGPCFHPRHRGRIADHRSGDARAAVAHRKNRRRLHIDFGR